MISINQNLKKVKAIEAKNKKKLLEINPELDEGSGIYFLTRVQPHGYIGQARHILTRLAQHMAGFSHIDNSIRAHSFYSEENPYGYKINFIKFPESKLDEMEQKYIQIYLDNGYELKNKTAGGQGVGKTKINEYKPAKGYHDGIKQGRKKLAEELLHIIKLHLDIKLKSGKENNKVSIKALDKFWRLLKGSEDGNE